MKWLILFLGVAANAAASTLVKIAMSAPYKFPSIHDPWSAVSNWPFWLGLSLYGTAFLLYSAALTRLPLNVAHPILTAGAIAMVALCSKFIFRENFYWTTMFGIFLVMAGVGLITIRGH